jgi:hypothetical protein
MNVKLELRSRGYSVSRFRRECGGIAPQTFDKFLRGEFILPAIAETITRKLEELRRKKAS